MIDLSKHEVKKRVYYPGSEDEWYEIRWVSPDKVSELDDDWKAFDYLLINWGGVKFGEEELECSAKNKKLFFEHATDRVQWLYEMSVMKLVFSPNSEMYLKNLKGLLNTSDIKTNGSSKIAEPV